MKVYKKKVYFIVYQSSSYLLVIEVTIKITEKGEHLEDFHLLQYIILECLSFS